MSATNNPAGGRAPATGSTSTSKTSDDVKSAVRGIKGLGDAIRGTAMEAVDSLDGGSKESEARHHAIAQQGAAEAKSADQRFGERRAERHENLGATGVGVAGGHGAAAATGHHQHHHHDPTTATTKAPAGDNNTNANNNSSSITNSKIARGGQ